MPSCFRKYNSETIKEYVRGTSTLAMFMVLVSMFAHNIMIKLNRNEHYHGQTLELYIDVERNAFFIFHALKCLSTH